MLLHVKYTLGKECRGLDKELLELSLSLNNNKYTATTDGYFETVFDKLKQQIGADYYFKNCYGCLYSDYNIYGNTSFGGMQCFYENKENYLKAESKAEFSELTNYKFVQETFVCDNFKERKPGTGYRG